MSHFQWVVPPLSLDQLEFAPVPKGSASTSWQRRDKGTLANVALHNGTLLFLSECQRFFSLCQGWFSAEWTFSRIFVLKPPDSFGGFIHWIFLLIFVGQSAQKNLPGKSLAKSSKIYPTNSLNTFLETGWVERKGGENPLCGEEG